MWHGTAGTYGGLRKRQGWASADFFPQIPWPQLRIGKFYILWLFNSLPWKIAIFKNVLNHPQMGHLSAKFTLNSKRFPRLKSTFPLWLNLQSSPRYIQNGFQPSSHFFLDRKPFGLVLGLLLGWTFLNYLCRRCSNALGSRGLGMLKKLFRA